MIIAAHQTLRTFVYRHDELPAFHAVYLLLTILVAAMLNLGFFAVLVVLHMALDVIKYRGRHRLSLRQTCEGVIRESLVDLALLSVGVAFAVYLHHASGLATVSGLLRAEATIARSVLTLIPKAVILHDVLKIVAHIHHYMDCLHQHLGQRWNQFERVCLWSIGISAVLLLVAGPMMHIPFREIQSSLNAELVPHL